MWETGLLWNAKDAPKGDSRATALKRLFSLEKKLDRDEKYAAMYYNEMKRFIDNGYATKAKNSTQTRTWYLSHFGVRNENKPGKVRLVFDAAAKTYGFSLNDKLDTGPDLLQSLVGVLVRFRQYAVAFKADIKDMYLRIKVREEDRGALKFLWRGSERKKYPEEYEMTCLVFGANSSPCSAIYIKDTNAKVFAVEKPVASRSIINNPYVDDFLSSCETAEEASHVIRDVIDSHANFAMHGWGSNDSRVIENMQNSASPQNVRQTQLCKKKTNASLAFRGTHRLTF